MVKPDDSTTIIDVGVSDVVGDGANVLERRYPHPERITAVGLGAGVDFQAAFPQIAYHQIEPNRPLPFPDGSFDVACANAVLEHVGSPANQRAFIADLLRVARQVVITVPHRYFPVEHHTAIPLLHYLNGTFHLACAATGKQFWSRQENLILMSARRLRQLCPAGSDAAVGYTGLILGPFSSNLYLHVRVPAAPFPGRHSG